LPNFDLRATFDFSDAAPSVWNSASRNVLPKAPSEIRGRTEVVWSNVMARFGFEVFEAATVPIKIKTCAFPAFLA
jgi:hypothetical protein